MKRWFMRMGERMARFMYGRYGGDEFNRFLTVVSLILLLLSLIRPLWFLWLAALVLMIWSNCRAFSKKLQKRRRENEVYLRAKAPFDRFFRLQKNKFRDRKTHHYFKCSHCRAVLRVPKGKGTIDVTCPRCQKITVKKT